MMDPDQHAHQLASEQVASIIAAAERAAEDLREQAERRSRERIAEADRAAANRVEAAEAEARETLADAREQALEIRHTAQTEADRVLSEARAERLMLEEEIAQVRAAAEEDARRTREEAEDEADDIRRAAQGEAGDIVHGARLAAREALDEGTQLSDDLREVGESLRTNAEKLFQDVRLAHLRLTASLDQDFPDSRPEARSERDRPRGDDLGGGFDIPEFVPPR